MLVQVGVDFSFSFVNIISVLGLLCGFFVCVFKYSLRAECAAAYALRISAVIAAFTWGQFHCDGRYKQKDLWSFKLRCFLEKYSQEIIPVYENWQCPCLFDATDKSNSENLWLDR